MSDSRPFVDETGSLDTDQIAREAVPIAKLVFLFGAIAFVPMAIAVLFGGPSGLGLLFTFVAQFVFAVGTGIVLLYVIARGLQLSG